MAMRETTSERCSRKKDQRRRSPDPAAARLGRTARDYVHATHPDTGLDVVFRPGELLPDWVKVQPGQEAAARVQWSPILGSPLDHWGPTVREGGPWLSPGGAALPAEGSRPPGRHSGGWPIGAIPSEHPSLDVEIPDVEARHVPGSGPFHPWPPNPCNGAASRAAAVAPRMSAARDATGNGSRRQTTRWSGILYGHRRGVGLACQGGFAVPASFPELGSRAAASSAYGHRVATPPLARPDRHTGPPGRIPVRSGGCPADRRPDDDVEACRVTRRSRFSGLGSSSCEPTVEVPTVALAHRKSPRAPPGAEIGGSDVEPGQPPTDPSARPASPRVLAGRFHVHTRGDGTEEHSHRGLGLRRARRARTRGHERVLPERRLAEHATVEVPAWRGTTHAQGHRCG